MEDLQELLEAAEPNPLLRAVDGLCASRAWDDLVTMAERCHQATERGKQLWPIAEHIEYRLALEAPPEYAGPVVTPQSGRFSLGPLTEVIASTHTFDEVAPHLGSAQVLATVAQERVIRGEDLRGDARAHAEVFELPLVLQGWEPRYPVVRYRAHDLEAESPEAKTDFEPAMAGQHERLDEPSVERALLELAASWVNTSEGSADAAVVAGDAPAAVAELDVINVRLCALTMQEAFAWMAWAAGSGGAHGRRRGAAYGRFAAWSAAAAILEQDWPCDPDELAREAAGLDWYAFACPINSGWHLDLAVHDPAHGWAAAVTAHDA